MKPSIYSLTRNDLIAWTIEHGEKSSEPHRFGIGFTVNVFSLLRK